MTEVHILQDSLKPCGCTDIPNYAIECESCCLHWSWWHPHCRCSTGATDSSNVTYSVTQDPIFFIMKIPHNTKPFEYPHLNPVFTKEGTQNLFMMKLLLGDIGKVERGGSASLPFLCWCQYQLDFVIVVLSHIRQSQHVQLSCHLFLHHCHEQ